MSQGVSLVGARSAVPLPAEISSASAREVSLSSRPIVWVAILILVILGACGRDEGAPAFDRELEEERILAVLEGFHAAWEQENVGAIEAIVVPDTSLIVVEQGRADVGWQAFRDVRMAYEFGRAKAWDLRVSGTRVRLSPAGDVAWAAYNLKLAATAEEGQAISVDGAGSAVLERRDGRWRIVHLHWSFLPLGQ